MLHLASTSPRRRRLLEQAGIPFRLATPGAEPVGDGDPAGRARLRARSKALGAEVPSGLALGVDTVVECSGAELGKPTDRGDAARMLRALAAGEHRVHTALCIVEHPAGVLHEASATARVRCRPLSDAELERYLDTGLWRGKAGAYGIQDDACDFAEIVAGARDTVIGLPVAELRELLAGLAGER